MNTTIAKAVSVLVLIAGFLLSAETKTVENTEKVDFTVRTTSPGGNFSPKNIGAIWIEDADGHFVRTLKVWAQKRIQYLYTWNARTGADKTDAVTGATLSSHQTHTVSWDMKDAKGNLVPNGTFTMRVELTDQHSQGPLGSYAFPVGQPTNTLTFSDENHYHDIEISWTSVTTQVSENPNSAFTYDLSQNYPNPFNPLTEIHYSLAQDGDVELDVFNSFGQKMTTLVHQPEKAGVHSVEFDATDLPSGLYFYRITTAQFSQTKKMMLVR